jgi:hypothetical protein
MLHGALLHVLMLGCAVSMMATGRLTVRLIVDGALSMAFGPAFVVLAFVVVFRTGTRQRVALPHAVDRFMRGNTPWLLCLIGFYAVTGFVPPRGLTPWLSTLMLMFAAALVWSLFVDFHYFRDANGRSRGGALRDVALHRAIAWTGMGVYFLGVAAWTEYAPEVARWIGR